MADQQQQQSAPPSAEQEPELEFKPVVKYACWGGLACLAVGVSYAAYFLGSSRAEEAGYQRGFAEALASGRVEAELNRLAVENLLAVLKLEHESDDQLLAKSREPELSFAWMTEPSVKLEAQWMLERELLGRGYVGEAMPLVAQTFAAAPRVALWCRRAAEVAYTLQQNGRLKEALDYYRYASKRFAELGMEHDHLVTCYNRLSLLSSTQCPVAECQEGLFELQREAEAMGERGDALRADVLVFLGAHYRRMGDTASARKCFESVLSGKNIRPEALHPQACVCYGQALYEMGKSDEARELFRKALKSMGGDPADLQYRLIALRSLAAMEVEAGRARESISLLDQAQGAAEGRIADSDSFWSSFYDQRGWSHFLAEQYEAALADFTTCLRIAGTERDTVQSLEGAGRCQLALGHPQEALPLLKKGRDLCLQYKPDDVESLALLNNELGRAEDSAGNTAQALDAYQAAARGYRMLKPAYQEKLHEVLRSVGYAAAELRQWKAAADAWAEVVTLCSDKPEALKEAQEQQKKCSANL